MQSGDLSHKQENLKTHHRRYNQTDCLWRTSPTKPKLCKRNIISTLDNTSSNLCPIHNSHKHTLCLKKKIRNYISYQTQVVRPHLVHQKERDHTTIRPDNPFTILILSNRQHNQTPLWYQCKKMYLPCPYRWIKLPIMAYCLESI